MVAELRRRVAEAEKSKLNSDNMVSKMRAEIKEIRATYPKREAELVKKLGNCEIELNELVAVLEKNTSRLEYMKSHTIRMKTGLDEMTVSKENMLKNTEKMNIEIQSLE